MNTCERWSTQSPFFRYMESVKHRRTYFWEGADSNNGDRLILMGTQHILKATGCELVDSPDSADQILMNGGGWFMFAHLFKLIAQFREEYGSLPTIMAPQTFRVDDTDFRRVCEINQSPLIIFARDTLSAESLHRANLPPYCKIFVSQDLAFELHDGEFIRNLRGESSEKHILIAMRKDGVGAAKYVAKVTAVSWLPHPIHRALSRAKDRLAALSSNRAIHHVLQQEKSYRKLKTVYRDVSSTSIAFDGFLAAIRDAGLIITDRMHVAILGHLLEKRVVIVCKEGALADKLKGIYDFSMSGPNSRTSLYIVTDSK